MSTYTYISNFGSKDALPEGDAGKVIKGVDFETEFNNIETAINDTDSTASANASAITALQDSKAPKASPAFTGTATFSNLNVSEGGTLSLGDNDDLKMFHNGVHAHLYDVGTGNLFIGSNGNGIGLQTVDFFGVPNGTLANFTNSGSCSFYYNNVKKFETTSTGVEVVGSIISKDNSIHSGSQEYRDPSTSTGYTYVTFNNSDGTTAYGSIQRNLSSISYNTSSDYRLKENVVTVDNAADRLKQLKPCRFNFIGEQRTVDGFLAHEAQEVVPESVTGEKDAVDSEGSPVYQGIDQSKLVPLLTAALQEALARIETLEATINSGGIE